MVALASAPSRLELLPPVTLLIAAVLIALAWALSVVLSKFRIPEILGFLGLGFAFGAHGLNIFHFSFASTGVGTVIALAASIILYECGRGLDISRLQASWRSLLLLVTVGVCLTAGLSALAAHLAFAWDWGAAVLLGAVIAATDPAAVIPVMRQPGMPKRVSQIAQAESALNDATGAMLTVVTIRVLQSAAPTVHDTLVSFGIMGLGGIGIGVVVAAMTAWLAHSERLGELDLGAHNQQVVELITVLIAYGLATYLGSSGYMAAFAAGLVHGRTLTRAPYATQPFFSTLSFLSRLAVFVMLGATFDAAGVVVPLLPTLAFVAFFVVVVRPIAVLSSVWADRAPRWSLREILLLSWVRETGVISAALAANVAALAIPNAEAIVAKTTAVILLTIVLQGTTTGILARRLHFGAAS
jgi:cell volume regulation protein A